MYKDFVFLTFKEVFPTLHAINQWIWFCIYLHITSMQVCQEKNLIQLGL